MANTSSAKKAVRKTERRSDINIKIKRKMKEARKALLKAVAASDKKQATSLVSNAQKQIDKAAKKGVIHKNTAARYKSGLVTKVNSLS